LTLSRSWTTRQRRDGEPEGAYTFVSRQAFEDARDRGVFYEWAEFNGELYGTPNAELAPSGDLLLEIDVQGAESVRLRDQDALIVLLVPPSMEALEERMRRRGDHPDKIAERLAIASAEIERARKVCDIEVVNQDVEEAVRSISTIIVEARSQDRKHD
jgi:guanylate kinase